MLYINNDINPFTEILEDAFRKNNSWFQPLELLEETTSILGEFIRVFKRIRPDSHWNGFIWNMETRSISRIQIQTRQQLELLKEQLTSTNQLANRQQVFELQRLTDEILDNLDYFTNTMPDWQKLDFSNKETSKFIISFIANGKKLTSDMENLISKINRLLQSR